jgi:2'-5' RNA ligase
VRLFLAIELDESLLGELEAAQTHLREAAPDASVRWSARENFHLTVLFLGELSADQLPALQDMCATIASETSDFRVCLSGLSAFPKPESGKPLKTLWVGVSEGAKEWKALVRRAEPWFIPLGVAKSDGLVPHVTLGRVREESEALREALTTQKETQIGAQQARGLALIESTLTPDGAIYTGRGRWSFQKSSPILSESRFSTVVKSEE